MNKKVMSMLLLSAMLFSVSGCGNTAKRTDNKQSTEKKDEKSENKMTIVDVDLNDPNLEEKWKKEPRYGTKIIIGYNGGLCTSGLGIAKVKGFLGKYGLEADITNVQLSSADAIGTGKIDATTDHISASVVPAVNASNMVFTRGAHTGCKSLYVLKDSNIQKTSDLVGKEIAIHNGIGHSDHNIALRFLSRDKVDYSKVKFKNVENAATIQAMQNGEVHASMFSDQFAQKFVDKGVIRPIRSITFDDDFKIEPCCVLILNKKFVEENPITAAKLTKAHKEASDWIEENKKEAAQVINQNNWGSGNVDSDQKFLETYNFKVSDEQTETSLTDILRDYAEFKLIKAESNSKGTLASIWRPIKK